jgi:hypothetical protein
VQLQKGEIDMAAVIELPVESTQRPFSVSAVSWPAIFAGAAAAAALSLILVVLGTGLGLASMSPWAGSGASVKAISWSTIAWLIFTALAASGLGGYIAGRLRMKWPELHTDEAYFRDTAHGFLSWAVATLLTAAVLTSVLGRVAGIGAGVGAAAATAAATQAPRVAGDTGPALVGMEGSGQVNQQTGYTVDALFRPAPSGTATPAVQGTDTASTRDSRGEVARIFANSLHTGQLPQEDTTYVGQLVAQRTGMSQQEAEARVNEVYAAAYKKQQDAEATAKRVADQARKDGAYASLWVFISLLGGAFFASLMATLGGRRRDLY